MSRLDELIQEYCPNGVKFQKLGEVLDNNNAPNCISKKFYRTSGKIPIIDQSQSFIAGYTDNESAVPPFLPCIIFGDHTRVIKYADKIFAQGDSGTKVFVPVSNHTNTRFIYYALCNLDIPSRGYNRHWSIVKDMTIPLPPLPVQEEIVRILDKFTALEAELEAELEARKKQYEYYRKKLFTYNGIIQHSHLKEVCTLFAGGDISKSELSKGKTPEYQIPVISNGIGNNSLYGWTNKAKIHAPCVTISARGTIGYSSVREYPIYPIVRLICAVPNKNLSVRFLHYFLQTQEFKVPNSGIPQLTIPMISKQLIPLPPLAEQERIVSILDRFDTLVNDISQGLPAEIEARRKQYEYYRNQLLTFKEATS